MQLIIFLLIINQIAFEVKVERIPELCWSWNELKQKKMTENLEYNRLECNAREMFFSCGQTTFITIDYI